MACMAAHVSISYGEKDECVGELVGELNQGLNGDVRFRIERSKAKLWIYKAWPWRLGIISIRNTPKSVARYE